MRIPFRLSFVYLESLVSSFLHIYEHGGPYFVPKVYHSLPSHTITIKVSILISVSLHLANDCRNAEMRIDTFEPASEAKSSALSYLLGGEV